MKLLRTRNEEDISLERLVSAISKVVEDLAGSRYKSLSYLLSKEHRIRIQADRYYLY